MSLNESFHYPPIKNFDYVHLHVPNPWVVLCLLFINPNKLIISWGSDIINQKILKILFYPFQYIILKKAYKIISLSKTYSNNSKDLKPFSKKITIIPPLINAPQKAKKRFDKNKVNILCIGRLVNYKRFDIAINSLNYVNNWLYL